MALIAVAIGGASLCASMSSSIAAALMGDEDPKKPTGPTGSTGPTGGDGDGKVPEPVGLYTIEQGLRHQGNNPATGKTEDLWYGTNHGGPWNKYYKFACEDSSGNESDKVGPYGPIAFGHYGAPTIRFAPKDTKPCKTNSTVVYRSDTKDGEYKAIHRNVKNAAVVG